MNHGLEILIVSAVIVLALTYVAMTVVKKFVAKGCTSDCGCGAKRLMKPQNKARFH